MKMQTKLSLNPLFDQFYLYKLSFLKGSFDLEKKREKFRENICEIRKLSGGVNISVIFPGISTIVFAFRRWTAILLLYFFLFLLLLLRYWSEMTRYFTDYHAIGISWIFHIQARGKLDSNFAGERCARKGERKKEREKNRRRESRIYLISRD